MAPPLNAQNNFKHYATVEEFNAYQQQLEERKRQTLITQDPDVEAKLQYANSNNKLDNEFNWLPGEGGSIPRDANGRSRMFLIRKDKDGFDTIVDYDGKQLADGTPLEFGSSAFWEQAQLGNVFAYPLGEAEPRQYLVSNAVGDMFRPQIGEPLDAQTLKAALLPPKPVAPPRPGFFKRLIHGVFKGAFRAEFDRYEQQRAAYQTESARWNAKAEAMDKRAEERGKVLGAEQQELQAKKVRDAEKMKREQLAMMLEKTKRLVRNSELGKQFSEAIYGSVPKILKTDATKDDPELQGRLIDGNTADDKDKIYDTLFTRKEQVVDEKTGKVKEKKHTGFYELEQLKGLTVLDKNRKEAKFQLDLEGTKVGETGRGVTESEFCALSFFTAMDPDVAIQAYPDSQSYNPTYPDKLAQIKDENGNRALTDAQVKEALTGSFIGFFTTDTYKVPPRYNSGKFFQNSINPAREKTAEALIAYKAGNLEPMGKLLANAVDAQAKEIAMHRVGRMGEELNGAYRASGNILRLLDADPKLMEAARKAGMKQEDLKTVRGGYVAFEMNEKALRSNVKLAEAGVEGKLLTDEEKRACVKDIIKAKVALQCYALQNRNTPVPEADKLLKSLPSPEIHNSVSRMYAPKPVTAMLLNSEKYQKVLDQVADEIVETDKLMEKDPVTLVKTLALGEDDFKLGNRGMEIMLKGNMLDEPTKELSAELGVDAPKLTAEPPKQVKPVAAAEKVNDVKPAAAGANP